jgi:tRNA G18 (ribose-2'-O)-methylase SpoU
MTIQLCGDKLHSVQKTKIRRDGPAIVLDNVADPRNVGSILRLAEAFGSRQVVVLGDYVDLKNSKTRATSRGCDEYLDIEYSLSRETLAMAPNLVAIEITDTSESLFDVSFDKAFCTLVVGNEEEGVSFDLLQACRKSVHIPMFGIKGSMNVATALAIVLYEWRRQEYETSILGSR